MITVLAFTFGFLLCLACSWRRLVELRRAFLAAVAESEGMRRREAEALTMLLKVQRELSRLRRLNQFGEPALLPPAASKTRAARTLS